MTESGASGSSFTGYFVPQKPASAGFLQPVVELRFCDEDGNEVASSAPGGEMWIRSPCVIAGYHRNEEANRAQFRDGWFRTGDIGYLDEDGCLHVYARAKDMVIRGGENIYPVEVEHCIEEMPGVVMAAAFGVPSEAYGEELAVVVQRDSDVEAAVGEDDIRRHCAARLAAFKVPAFVCITDQPLPMNAVNKVIKRQLRERYFSQSIG